MKNLHLLPTDKPSRLLINWEKDLCYKSKPYLMKGTQNIYITSEEKIKGGDWIYSIVYDKIYQATEIANIIFHATGDDKNNWRKIILTTDQDLINNGIQAIDDEFLEWFIKSPSCECVNIEKTDTFKKTDEIYVDEITGGNYHEIIKRYKIVIPKEEPEQEISMDEVGVSSTQKFTFKEETLEEVKRPVGDFIIENATSVQMPDGAYYHYSEVCKLLKLQQERSYSEEEVLRLLRDFNNLMGDVESVKEWFEQFKKK